MKTRRVIFHAFLSLLLLVSQQIGFAHVISHGIGGGRGEGGEQVRYRLDTASKQSAKQSTKQSPSQLLTDQSCEQCLSFAQFGSGLTNDIHSCQLGDAERTMLAASATPFAHLPRIYFFQPRAPPSAPI